MNRLLPKLNFSHYTEKMPTECIRNFGHIFLSVPSTSQNKKWTCHSPTSSEQQGIFNYLPVSAFFNVNLRIYGYESFSAWKRHFSRKWFVIYTYVYQNGELFVNYRIYLDVVFNGNFIGTSVPNLRYHPSSETCALHL